MRRLKQTNLGIKQYTLLLTLLPSLLITTALTAYLIVSRQADAQQGLLTNATNTINYLASTSELALFSGDKLILNRLASATVFNQDMKSVTFFDSQGKEILTAGEMLNDNKIYTETSIYREEQQTQWLLQTPVFNSQLEVEDFPDISEGGVTEIKNTPIEFLGWVQITADKTSLKQKQRSILVFGAAFGILVFTLLALLAQRFSHSITIPLDKITKTVRRLESGDLSARVDVEARGEMNDLVNGINQLAGEVQTSQVNLQKNVDLATAKLTHALDDLERLNTKLKTNVIQEREQREEQEQMLLRQCRMANMGEMLDSIAHQWRQPLMHINSILMNMDSALESIEEGKGGNKGTNKGDKKKYLENKIDDVASLTSHMSQTIEDFRDLFKIESEQTEFPLDLAINDVLVLMKNSFKDIELIKQIESDLSITGYRGELIQVIIILLSNAVEALNIRQVKEKKISIKIESHNEKISIITEDNAGGISSENINSIFDPYFTTKEQSGGTGLGLYIAKIIIEQKMGGNIAVSNTETGVRFLLTFKKL